jgi:hypothetical protein
LQIQLIQIFSVKVGMDIPQVQVMLSCLLIFFEKLSIILIEYFEEHGVLWNVHNCKQLSSWRESSVKKTSSLSERVIIKYFNEQFYLLYMKLLSFKNFTLFKIQFCAMIFTLSTFDKCQKVVKFHTQLRQLSTYFQRKS